jgi:MoaA/NifB/PqqE/SkfB family radical SAM enzyme
MEQYYCNQKFWWLTVDLEKKLLYSCCSARPEKINLAWLKNNNGQLFNTPLLQQERQQMLDNVPVDSCKENCWIPESNGITSRRQWMQSTVATHTDVGTKSPTTLNIILGSTCNLTCSYCCKQYSSAWRQDILNNGPYVDNRERFNLTTQDHLLLKISHNDHASSGSFRLLLDEMLKFDQVEHLIITGGEPLLYKGFVDILNEFAHVSKITFYTGLGTTESRLDAQLSKIKNKHNVEIIVSVENCGALYEFNRFGNSWKNFVNNLNYLKQQNFDVKFSSVISNLTVFGLSEFLDHFPDDQILYNWCNEPEFLAVNVLDDSSKQQLISKFENTDHAVKHQLISNLEKSCTEKQRQDLACYIKEFSKRRKLKLDIFPESMLQWLNYERQQCGIVV